MNRQIERLTAQPPQPVDQETRRYDAWSKETIVLRSKDDAPDYRYMPDPELPPLILPKVCQNSKVHSFGTLAEDFFSGLCGPSAEGAP